MDLLPDAMQAPLTEGRIRGLPWRRLAREITPGTTGTQDVKDGVDEEPQRPGARPAAPCWRWQQRRQQRPFGIREVTRIEGASIHGRAWHRRCLLWERRVGGLWHT